ncbi:multicopper oxidase [Methylobacter sp.]|uniref:multicopper oxidase family protein n=1 Tax=Methylobacter sp. TaxID=2051955 RepID=UPI0012008814|nr:multicopper oxidase [Methylobacter sp.]TAK59656.1 MAG: bilirubin oxidase [Methylobacter sp.]
MSKKIHQFNNEGIHNDAFPVPALLSPRTKAVAGLIFVLPWIGSPAWAALPGGTLDPATIPKYVSPLFIPPEMPKALNENAPGVDYYKIATRQISQQILPKPLPKTKVWAYGSSDNQNTFHSPSYTIEASVNRPVRVTWINDLKDSKGHFLPHMLPVDQTVHWANPPGGPGGQDSMGTDPKPYTGPVPLVTHLHGANVVPGSDGYPESWTLPAASNIPAGYATRGTHWAQIEGENDEAGEGTYQYSNDQRATQMWFHDHTLGMTRSNVYAGLAGNYMLRGGMSDLPSLLLPQGAYEIPLLIQDRAFNSDGSLFYPGERAFFEGLAKKDLRIPFIPHKTAGGSDSDVSPIWNPEYFSNVMLVNGHSWPKLDVEKRRYRFRILNASDSRFMILKIAGDPTTRPATEAVPFWVVGGDGGFQTRPAKLNSLLIGPAERIDVVVDFTNVPAGTPLYLINEAPDEPYGGGEAGVDYDFADPETTGQVMKFTVIPRTAKDKSVPPQQIQALLPPQNLGNPTNIRKVSVNEMESGTVFADYNIDSNGSLVSIIENLAGVPFGPTISMLGTLDSTGAPAPFAWMDPVTENPGNGTTETWEIYNFTEDAHPIHMHLVEFQIESREPLQTDSYGMPLLPATPLSAARGPEAWERGSKDTVIAYPGEVTRVKARFDRPGLYVWHCHILSHEDNDMMRPICVGNQADCPVPLANSPKTNVDASFYKPWSKTGIRHRTRRGTS